MFNMLSVVEKEAICFDYFKCNNIINKTQLKDCLKKKPLTPDIRSTFIEDMFLDYLDLQKSHLERRAQQNNITKPYKRSIVLSDMHIPFHDELTLNNVFNFIIDQQPDYLILLGDILDCYMLSRFTKRPDCSRNLQYEIDLFKNILTNLLKQIPQTEVHYILGNHEQRLETFLLENPGLFGLKALTFENLLGLNDLGITLHKQSFNLNDFIYFHGDKVSSKSAVTARTEYSEHQGRSGISGHTHRLGAFYDTYDENVRSWYENGCLCDTKPTYFKTPEKANWQQGFSIIDHFDNTTRCQQILITNHSFMFGDTFYNGCKVQ